MKENFSCPHCKQSVYDEKNKKITLKGLLKGMHFRVDTTVELNHQKNEFGGKILNDEITWEKGLQVDFFCPHCNADLTAEYDKDLTEILHIDKELDTHAFVISKIAGREMSFLVCKDRKEILESFGKDKDEYLNKFYEYFNMWGKF